MCLGGSRTTEDVPRRLQDVPRRLQDVPWRLQDVPRSLQDVPQRLQSGSGSAEPSRAAGRRPPAAARLYIYKLPINRLTRPLVVVSSK